MLQRYKKIAHLQVFYLLNVRLFYLDAIRGLFQCPHDAEPLFGIFYSRMSMCFPSTRSSLYEVFEFVIEVISLEQVFQLDMHSVVPEVSWVGR